MKFISVYKTPINMMGDKKKNYFSSFQQYSLSYSSRISPLITVAELKDIKSNEGCRSTSTVRLKTYIEMSRHKGHS